MNEQIATAAEVTATTTKSAAQVLSTIAKSGNTKAVVLVAVAAFGAYVAYTNYKALWAERKSSKAAK